MILAIQKAKIGKRKEEIKLKLRKEDKTAKSKKDKVKEILYNEKEIFINNKIDKDILYFKNNYHQTKKDIFELRR